MKTTRQIRAELFTHSTPAADALRRSMFAVEDQDAPASPEHIAAYERICPPPGPNAARVQSMLMTLEALDDLLESGGTLSPEARKAIISEIDRISAEIKNLNQKDKNP